MLSQTAEYALRAMAWIATLPDDASARAKDLSAATDIPPHYVSKILRRLVRARLLVSRRGHGGGFVLARRREDIRFADVLSAVDALPARDDCAFGWGDCDEAHPCPLHASWSHICDAFHDWAARCTLADVSAVDPVVQKARRG